MPLESEVPQLDEIASQPSEAANESHATTEEQTEIAKAAMNELNQKARRRNLRKEQKKAKKLEQMRNQAPILKQPARQTEWEPEEERVQRDPQEEPETAPVRGESLTPQLNKNQAEEQRIKRLKSESRNEWTHPKSTPKKCPKKNKIRQRS